MPIRPLYPSGQSFDFPWLVNSILFQSSFGLINFFIFLEKVYFHFGETNNLIELILFILALARLRAPIDDTKVRVEGIDIVLAVDSSGSMLAEDFKIAGNRQNRLEAAKEVIDDFIKTRANDRFGLVTFAARAYTVCPLTLDHAWVLKKFRKS